jgi:hypothetical protein
LIATAKRVASDVASAVADDDLRRRILASVDLEVGPRRR